MMNLDYDILTVRNDTVPITDGSALENNETIIDIKNKLNEYKILYLIEQFPKLINEIEDNELKQYLLIKNISLYMHLINNSNLDRIAIINNAAIKNEENFYCYIKFITDSITKLQISSISKENIYKILHEANKYGHKNIEVLFINDNENSYLEYYDVSNKFIIHVNLLNYVNDNSLNQLKEMLQCKKITFSYKDNFNLIQCLNDYRQKVKDNNLLIDFFFVTSSLFLYYPYFISTHLKKLLISCGSDELVKIANYKEASVDFRATIIADLLSTYTFSDYANHWIIRNADNDVMTSAIMKLKINIHNLSKVVVEMNNSKNKEYIYNLNCEINYTNAKAINSLWSRIKYKLAVWLIS